MRPAAELEIERKYALSLDQEVPSLAGTVVEGPVNSYQLVAAYYDTPDLRLRAQRLVIRRRSGGRDDGWHLKAPGQDPDHRVELQLPIDGSTPGLIPQPFWDEVSARIGDQPLVPVATLRTWRQERDLLGADHSVLARLCIDEVHSEASGHTDHWREAEVELDGGELSLLNEVEAVLAAAGISRATDVAKIARALGSAPLVDDRPTAGGLVQSYLADQLGALQHWYRDPSGLVGGDAHDGRVACRRLRSVLGTYQAAFARGTRGRVRAELRWLGLQLSPARDAEVVVARIEEGVAALGADTELARSYRERVVHARLVALEAGLDRVRVASLLASLEGVLLPAALSRRASGSPATVLVGSWRQAVEQVRSLVAAAQASGDEQDWHSVRKAAKAARYAAELLAGGLAEFGQVRDAWERVTEALGVMQDAVVTQLELRSPELASLGASPDLLAELSRREADEQREALERGRGALTAALALEL